MQTIPKWAKKWDHVPQPKPGPGRKGLLRPDLNLRQVAKKAGISAGYLTQIMHGQRRPSFDLAFRLTEAMGFKSVDELKGWLDIYKAQVEAWKHEELTTKEIWKSNVSGIK